MDINKQVNTPNQGKILHNLGLIPNTKYFWCFQGKTSELCHVSQLKNKGDEIYYSDTNTEWLINEIYPAYSVAELGLMLPKRFYTLKSSDKREIEKGEWCCLSQRIGEYSVYGATEAEARAAMVIQILEYGTISVGEINELIK